jgi:hypothetical protein
MTDTPKDPLDSLLRQWHGQNMPAEPELERLRDRIVKSVGEAGFLDVPSEPPPRALRALRAMLWFSMGAAAAIAMMLCFRPGNQPQQPETAHQDQPEALPSAVQLSESVLAEKARLLAGMEETFNGQLAWVAEHGGHVEVGLAPETTTHSGDAKPLAVRVVVLARKTGEAAWKPIWQADAIAHNDEIVDLAAKGLRGGNLRLWMHPLPDGAIAVDSDLAVSGTVPVRSTFSGVQQGGVPQRVFALQNEDWEYQVYQTAALLAAR